MQRQLCMLMACSMTDHHYLDPSSMQVDNIAHLEHIPGLGTTTACMIRHGCFEIALLTHHFSSQGPFFKLVHVKLSHACTSQAHEQCSFRLPESCMHASPHTDVALAYGAGRTPQARFQASSKPAVETSVSQTDGHQHPSMQSQHSGSAAETVSMRNGDTHAQSHPQGTGHLQQSRSHQPQHRGQEQQDAVASGQFVGALFAVLQQPLLPSTCLQQVGWLLSQLLAHAQSGSSQLLLKHKPQLEQVRICFAQLADKSRKTKPMRSGTTLGKLMLIPSFPWVYANIRQVGHYQCAPFS